MVRLNSDLVFIDTSGQIRSTQGSLTLRADDTGANDIIVGSGISLRPEINSDIDLGRNYLRWDTLYTTSGNFLDRPTVNNDHVLVQSDTFSGIFALTFAKQDALQSTTSTSFVNGLTLTTPSLESGTYRVGWSFQISADKEGIAMVYRVQLDDTQNLMLLNQIFDKPVNETQHHLGGFDYVTLSTGVHFVDIDFRTTDNSKSAMISDARLEIWKML